MWGCLAREASTLAGHTRVDARPPPRCRPPPPNPAGSLGSSGSNGFVVQTFTGTTVTLKATGNITLLSTGDGLLMIGVFAAPAQAPADVVLAQMYYICNGEG